MNIKSFFTGVFLAAGLTMGMTLPASAQTAAAADTHTLFIVEHCEPFAKGGLCSLALLPQRAGQADPANTQTECAPGWTADLMGLQGTVEGGGINRGSALVCGYPTAQDALRAAIKVCDEQMNNICSKANDVRVSWGKWEGKLSGDLTDGQRFKVSELPGATTCLSEVPLKATADCSSAAVNTLRGAGIN